MRNTMKTVIISLFMLSMALGAHAKKAPDSVSCGFMGKDLKSNKDVKKDSGKDKTTVYTYALNKAAAQCDAVGNTDAKNEYNKQADQCGKKGKSCADDYMALKDEWCGYRTGAKLPTTDYNGMSNQISETATSQCAGMFYFAADHLADGYTVTRSDVCGKVGLQPQKSNADRKALCLDTYDALFKPYSPY